MNAYQRNHNRYFLSLVELKHYNVLIDGRRFFDQPVKNDKNNTITFERLQMVIEMIFHLVVS